MRRRSVVALAALMLTVLPACQFAKVGARCSANQGAARNTTHVLFCVKGRWKASLTIGQAADIIISTWPGRVDVVRGADITVTAGQTLPPVVLSVITKGGRPAEGAEVRLRSPGLFAGADEVKFTTLAGGFLSTGAIGPRVGSKTGDYVVEVSAGPLPNVLTTLKVKVVADKPASMVMVSGNDQRITAGGTFQPWVVKVLDALGNPVPGIKFATSVSGLDGSLNITDNNGTYTITAPAQYESGTLGLTLGITETGPTGIVTTLASVQIRGTIDSGPVVDALISGGGQTATVNTAFASPVQVMAVDQYDNPVPGTTVTLTIVPGMSGASGTITSSNTLFTTGAQAFLQANGTAGEWIVRADVAGLGTHDFVLENVV